MAEYAVLSGHAEMPPLWSFGGREIRRSVDLETMPLYVAAGSVLPLGPVKQHTNERVDQSLSISIYPGADSSFLLYEDDGRSFNYRQGEWTGTRLNWNDASRTLTPDSCPRVVHASAVAQKHLCEHAWN